MKRRTQGCAVFFCPQLLYRGGVHEPAAAAVNTYMTPFRLFLLPALLTALPALAQAPDPPPPPADPPPDARKAGDQPYRYPLPALAQTVREVQHSTQAMLLMEYCADERIPDAFVNQRLAEFSRQTGRQEDCRTLLEY